jgi:signal transduction histidine kinase
MVVRINDLTNALERRRLMDWAHLAHDMQTNLSVIRLSAESLPNDHEEYNRQKVKILNQATILLRRVRDIMTIARNKTTEFQKISSEEICRRVIDELDTSSLYSITVKTNIQSAFFDADPERIIRAIMNAAQNGIKAMAGTEGILTITTFSNQESVCFAVSDTGVGMDEATKKNMFVPFFTTSRRGGGSGIGSMVIQKTMNDHNGKITIDSQIGEGTTITFIFPKKQSQGVKI